MKKYDNVKNFSQVLIEGVDQSWNFSHISKSPTGITFNDAFHDRQGLGPKPVEIDAPLRGVKPELIDGRWFWVQGCVLCTGNSKGDRTNYFCCEEHNRCISCRTHRSELTETPWGVCINEVHGIRCKPCQEAAENAERSAALAEVQEQYEADGEYSDDLHHYSETIVCPHCHLSTTVEDDPNVSGNETCERCEGEYSVETDISISYTTNIVGNRVTK